jgi:RNA polymerase sigma-70 factor (ECF subfamily)
MACQPSNAVQRLMVMRSREGSGASPEADFDAYFKSLLPRVEALARRASLGRQDAEDIAIEAFARAYMRWSWLRRVSWRDGWVLRVALNLCVDAARRRSRSVPFESIARDNFEESAVDSLVLVSALEAIPRRQREAVVLSDVCDLSTDQVARVMHISVGSVKVHLHRGRAALRLLLAPTYRNG